MFAKASFGRDEADGAASAGASPLFDAASAGDEVDSCRDAPVEATGALTGSRSAGGATVAGSLAGVGRASVAVAATGATGDAGAAMSAFSRWTLDVPACADSEGATESAFRATSAFGLTPATTGDGDAVSANSTSTDARASAGGTGAAVTASVAWAAGDTDGVVSTVVAEASTRGASARSLA